MSSRKSSRDPWDCLGANCYYLMTRAAAEDPGLKREALDVLDAATCLGISAIRAWAFCDGEHWNALQPTAGQFDERVFQGLDFVIAQARARGLQLILVLTDYFPPYGGLQQYVRWSRGLGKDDPVCTEHFYTDTHCHAMFESFCSAVLLRVNMYTGLMYCEDPTIMAWEICNEPRCKRSSGVPSEAMHAWTSKAAAYIHRLDPNHLVTTGTEGFFGPSSPGLLSANPNGCEEEGCDFVRTLMDPQIDFATFHLHPDHWLPQHTSTPEVAEFVQRYMHAHITAAREAGKPLVLAEFGSRQRVCSEWRGCKMDGTSIGTETQQSSSSGQAALAFKRKAQAEERCMERAALYEEVLSLCMGSSASQQIASGQVASRQIAARSTSPKVGAFFWMLAAPSYPDYDGFSVYQAKQADQALPSWIPGDSVAVAAVLQRYSNKWGGKAL